MQQVTNILVPTNFSKASHSAIKLAAKWSSILHAGMIVLHTYRLIPERTGNKSPSARELKIDIENRKRKQFLMLQTEIDLSHSEHLEFKLQLGFLNAGIEMLTNEMPIDLIIYGVDRAEDILTDIKLKIIIQDTHKAVLVVPSTYDTDQSDKIELLKNKIISVEGLDFIQSIQMELSTLTDPNQHTYLIYPIPTIEKVKAAKSILDQMVKLKK